MSFVYDIVLGNIRRSVTECVLEVWYWSVVITSDMQYGIWCCGFEKLWRDGQ